MRRWRWIRHGDKTIRDVAVLEDGSLYNPNGYPDELVREGVAGAEQRRYERRTEAAKRAAVNRRDRQHRRVYAVARRIVDSHTFGPASSCTICGKDLSDQDSIERGIGSECWQFVLAAITREREEVKT